MQTFPLRRHSACCLLVCLWALWSGKVAAEPQLWGGRPVLGMALERETSADKSLVANSVIFTPGLRLNNGGVNRIDLLLQAERDTDSSIGTDTFTRFNSVAVRLRKDVPQGDKLGMYFTGLAGRTQGEGAHYWYGYSEAGMLAKHGWLNFLLGARVHRTLYGSADQNFNKLIAGPGFDLGDGHELEFRWQRAWQADGNAFDSDAVRLEYIYKF